MNGYSNYATWVVVEYIVEYGLRTTHEGIGELQELIHTSIDKSTNDLTINLVNYALSDVNWQEVFDFCREA